MAESSCHYEELAHTAEIGLHVKAPTLPALFACAARALFALVGSMPTGEALQSFEVTIESVDVESLLVDWLSELVYLYETSGLVCDTACVLAWSPQRLHARVEGRRATQAPRLHVKAVTYHGLSVRESPTGWEATLYLDI
jgi:SHS2 domain-containing protein